MTLTAVLLTGAVSGAEARVLIELLLPELHAPRLSNKAPAVSIPVFRRSRAEDRVGSFEARGIVASYVPAVCAG
jgi:hypothetical protein